MAGLRFTVSNSAMIAGTNNQWITMLRLTAPSAIGVKVKTININTNGTNPTQGKPEIQIVKGVTGGTAGASVTAAKKDGHTGSVQSTSNENFSGEPTVNAANVVKALSCHPQSGVSIPMNDLQLNPAENLYVRVKVSGTLSVVVDIDAEE